MENYHLFTIKAVPATETAPAKVSIYSERHGQETIVSQTEYDAFGAVIKSAAKVLREAGYNIIGEAEGQLNVETNIKTMYLISDTFKPLLIKATYISVWDGGTTIRSKCLYDPIILNVSEVAQVEADGLDICEREYLELPGGEIIERENFTVDFDEDK